MQIVMLYYFYIAFSRNLLNTIFLTSILSHHIVVVCYAKQTCVLNILLSCKSNVLLVVHFRSNVVPPHMLRAQNLTDHSITGQVSIISLLIRCTAISTEPMGTI